MNLNNSIEKYRPYFDTLKSSGALSKIPVADLKDIAELYRKSGYKPLRIHCPACVREMLFTLFRS